MSRGAKREPVGLTKADRLAIGGALAPRLRQEAAAGGGRKIKVVDASGAVVREISKSDLAVGVLARADIEFSVPPGDRPKLQACLACKKKFLVPEEGTVPKLCPTCAAQTVCAGPSPDGDVPCPEKAAPGKSAFHSVSVRARRGAPWRCMSCAHRSWDPSKRQTVCVGVDGARCPKMAVPSKLAFDAKCVRRRGGGPWKCRSCAMVIRNAQTSPEQRSASARHMQASMSPGQRSEVARLRNAQRTPEQRSEMARKRATNKTPEQRSETVRRAWATRRANATKAKGGDETSGDE